jgi:hypothetical protein
VQAPGLLKQKTCRLMRHKKGENKMLKLNASFSKKVPAEQEYSSKSYHASIEMELPDGLTEEQLKGKVSDTFRMVRESVESEIRSGIKPAKSKGFFPQKSSKPRTISDEPASPKQIRYLLDLGRQRGMSPVDISEYAGVQDISLLTRQECSKLIDEFGSKAA